MGSDTRLDPPPAGELEASPLDLGAPEDQGTDAGPGRGGVERWADTVVLLLLVLLLLLSPLLYDLGHWLQAH